jgi:hypothetical protein
MTPAAAVRPDFTVAKKSLGDVLDNLSDGPAGVRIDKRLRTILVNAAAEIQTAKDAPLLPNAKQEQLADSDSRNCIRDRAGGCPTDC